MFIETSAVVAILAGEAEAAVFLNLIDGAERRETGAHVRLEATINLARILGLSILDSQDLYDDFIRAARIPGLLLLERCASQARALPSISSRRNRAKRGSPKYATLTRIIGGPAGPSGQKIPPGAIRMLCAAARRDRESRSVVSGSPHQR